MKNIVLLLVTLLSLTSCASTMDSFKETVRSINRMEGNVRYMKNTYDRLAVYNPYKTSKSGTKCRYKDKGSNTVFYLQWNDVKMYRDGKYLIIYNTKNNYVIDRLYTLDYNQKSYDVQSYSSYYGEWVNLTVEVSTRKRNVSVRIRNSGLPTEYYNL